MDFRDWKYAGTGKMQKEYRTSVNLEGFAKPANSHIHKEAMKIWEEHKIRSSRSALSVNTMILHRIPGHRRWVETVFTVAKYLAINGLPFQGDIENTNLFSENVGGGF